MKAYGDLNLWICLKICGFHDSDYEECRLLGYKNPGRTSQETHYVSATESSQIMLCRIWGFHGGDYEECRLLAYKNPVRTSQETHYFSTTESSQLMLCRIWGFHGGDYEECRLTGYKNPVRSSQETHYFSDTAPSRVILLNKRSRVRFSTLPDFLSGSGSGSGSTQPLEDKWGATWKKSNGSGLENWD
jgi:hypothetical protein